MTATVTSLDEWRGPPRRRRVPPRAAQERELLVAGWRSLLMDLLAVAHAFRLAGRAIREHHR